MKKLIAFLICISLFLTGCGAPTAETQPETTEATPTTVATEAPTEAATEAPTEAVAAEEGTIAETVVYDDGTFKLTAKEIDYSDDYSIKIKVLAENNSDKNVSFTGTQFSVNGITMYCGLHENVAPGKKSNGSIDITRENLEKYGIKSIATVKAQDAYIYNKDDKKTITRFQFSLETSISDGYVQEIDKSGQTIYDKDGIIIKYRGIETDWTDNEILSFYVENRTDSDINIFSDDVSVNGFMIYGSMVAHAYAGCVTYDGLSFLSSDLEENDIDSIEEVSFSLHASDSETKKRLWTTDEITVGRVPQQDATPNTEAATPATEAQNEDTIKIGNLVFPVDKDSTIKEAGEGLTDITLPDGNTYIGIYVRQFSGDESDIMRTFKPKTQHSACVEALVGNNAAATDHTTCKILGATINLDLVASSGGLTGIIGTFDDGEYIYTIIYAFSGTGSASSRGEQFTEFANGITTEKESLEITSVK